MQPPNLGQSRGAHISFIDRGGMAYTATCGLTREGLKAACEKAQQWLEVSRRHALIDAERIPRPQHSGDYASAVATPWETWGLKEKLELLQDINHQLKIDDAIVDWQAHLSRRQTDVTLVTSDDINIEQAFHYIIPGFSAVANQGAQEMASYGFDDDGTPAERSHLIRDGILLRPLGGAMSQARAGMTGVVNTRACDWNRPAIDRMTNLNLEPGSSSLNELIASIKSGVLMETNRSWSIDDSRNKFQFGGE